MDAVIRFSSLLRQARPDRRTILTRDIVRLGAASSVSLSLPFLQSPRIEADYIEQLEDKRIAILPFSQVSLSGGLHSIIC